MQQAIEQAMISWRHCPAQAQYADWGVYGQAARQGGPSRSDSLTRLGDRLLFISFLEILEPEQDFRMALWSTDGTRDGTVLLTNPLFTKFQEGLERIVLGQEMFFLDAKNGPTQIWRTDGTPAGTFPSLLVPPGSEPTAIHGVDGQLMIEAQGPGGSELWWSEVNLLADELVGAFFDVGEPTRLNQLVR